MGCRHVCTNGEIQPVPARPHIGRWVRRECGVGGIGLLRLLVEGLEGDLGLEDEPERTEGKSTEVTVAVTRGSGRKI